MVAKNSPFVVEGYDNPGIPQGDLLVRSIPGNNR